MNKTTKDNTGQSSRRMQKSKEQKKKAFGKRTKAVTIAIVILAVIIYGGGVFYYRNHFPHNTYINGHAVGEKTLSQAEEAFTGDYDSHAITIKEKERTETIRADEVDAVIKVGSQIADFQASLNPWLWFTNLIGKNDQQILLDVTYDEDKLAQKVNQLECFKKENVTAQQDAYIKAGDTRFEIVPEVLGNTVKKQKLLEAIGTDFTTCVNTIDLEAEDLYKLPSVYEKDEVIQKALEKANKYAASSVTYDFQYTTETLDYKTTKDWIKISDDFKVSVDQEKVDAYLNKLGATYNTMGASRDFTTSGGEKINAYGGDYGWKIYHDKEEETLIKNLEAGKAVTREPEYSYKAMCRNSDRDDIGDSYVEVSIKEQKVWLYVNGECKVTSSVVTGTPNGYETYTGVYSITYKKADATLTGTNANGSGYSSAVSFWMPFNGGQGLHDASWRTSFGGSIYKTNGSHGCVNCPPATAEVLFKYVEKGFPVVIY